MAIIKKPNAINMRMDDRVKYAINPKKTEKLLFASAINCMSAETAYEEMQAIKRSFGKEGGVQGYSFIQSFMPGEVTPEAAHEIAVKLAQRYFGDRYQVVIGTHLDKNHIHSHLIVNSVSFTDGQKYLNRLHYLNDIRWISDDLCREYGLSVLPRKKHTISECSHKQWREKKKGIPLWDDIMRHDIDEALISSVTFKQFLWHMQELGYEIKSGFGVKYMTICPPGSKGKGHRVYRLGENYTEKAINLRLGDNALRYFRNHGRTPLSLSKQTAVKEHKRQSPYFDRHLCPKISGLRGLYYHYLYLLKKIERSPFKMKRATLYRYRAEVIKRDQYIEQVRILNRERIHTLDALHAYQEKVKMQAKAAYTERSSIYRKRAQMTYSEYKRACEGVRRKLQPLRNELKNIERIEARSQEMHSALREKTHVKQHVPEKEARIPRLYEQSR